MACLIIGALPSIIVLTTNNALGDTRFVGAKGTFAPTNRVSPSALLVVSTMIEGSAPMMRHAITTQGTSLRRIALLSVLGLTVASCGSDDGSDVASDAGETTIAAEMDMDAEQGHEDEGPAEGYEFG